MHLHKFRTVHSADDKITTTSRRKPKKKVEKQRLYQFMPTYFQAQFVPANSAKLEIPSTKFEPQRVVGCFLVDWSVGRLLGRLLGWSVCLLVGWFIGRLVDLLQHLHTRSSFFHANNSLTICFCFLLSFLSPSLPYFLQLRLEGGRECAAGYSSDVRRSICAARVR